MTAFEVLEPKLELEAEVLVPPQEQEAHPVPVQLLSAS